MGKIHWVFFSRTSFQIEFESMQFFFVDSSKIFVNRQRQLATQRPKLKRYKHENDENTNATCQRKKYLGAGKTV